MVYAIMLTAVTHNIIVMLSNYCFVFIRRALEGIAGAQRNGIKDREE